MVDDVAAGMSAAPAPAPALDPADLPSRVAQLEGELADAKALIGRLADTIEGAAGDVGLASKLNAVCDWIMKSAGERL